MKHNVNARLSKSPSRLAIVLLASAVAAAAAHAHASSPLVLVPPAELPKLAQQSGEAMLLHETRDGRTLLYVEQDRGSRLAAFDVTDPARVKGAGSVQLEDLGPFDFVSPLGHQQELIEYRVDHRAAVLDLHGDTLRMVNPVQGPTLPGPVTPLGDEGFTVSGQAARLPVVRDYQVIETGNTPDLRRAFDVKQVRAEVTNAGTGTTFLLTDNGLYLIRRPSVESDKKLRDQEWFLEHSGG